LLCNITSHSLIGALACRRVWTMSPRSVREASMDKLQWASYLWLLERTESAIPSVCVGCWYEQHPTGRAFPGDRISSTLCPRHLLSLSVEVKRPDSLAQRRYT
jgi:hypothetical protein